MAIQNINRGTTANDGQGDSARAGALKINENFAYLLNAEVKFKAILGPEITSETISTDVVEAINTGGSFTLAFANLAFIKYFEIVDGDIKNIYFFKIVNIGGGNKTFGTNGSVFLTEINLFLTGQKLKSVQDFQELNSTVTEDFGDIGTTSLIDYVNGISPAITIQATSTGATILKAIVDDIAESFLFKGDAGDYGQGELQLVDEDLEALSETSQVSGADGGNAATLNNFYSSDFVRRTGDISEDITGFKNFIENIITQGDLLANNIIKRNGTINEILLANGATLLKSALEFSNRQVLLNHGEDSEGKPTYNGVKVDTTIAQRDVLDILTSLNTAVSLSANMGRVLKNSIPTDNIQIANGRGYVTSKDGGDAATLGELQKSDFIRKTDNIAEDVTGPKTFLGKLLSLNGSGTRGSSSFKFSFYSFFSSDGVTRKGVIGFTNSSIDDFGIVNEISGKSLLLKEDGRLLYDGRGLEFSNRQVLLNHGEDSDGNPTYNGVKVDTTIAQRDVLDVLDSFNTAVSLSANMGRVLKNSIPTNNSQIANGKGFITKSGNVAEIITGLKTFREDLEIDGLNTYRKIKISASNFTSARFEMGMRSAREHFIAAIGYETTLEFLTGNIARYFIDKNGNHDFKSGTASFGGQIFSNQDIVAFASDIRLKENTKVISNPIDKIKSLSGFTYNWNKIAQKEAGFKRDYRLVGVSANDIQKVLPEAVKLAPFDNDGNGKSKSGENYLTVQYDKIVPLLIEGMKDQQKQIDSLQSQIDELKLLIKHN